MINLYQQRDFGEKINATFTYATKEFRSLGLALLYIAGPVTLVAGIAGGIYQSNMLKTIGLVNGTGFGGIKTNPLAIFEQILSPAYWLLILFSLLGYVLVSLTVYNHLNLYDRNPREPITVGAVWHGVQASLLGGMGITLLIGLALFVGALVIIFLSTLVSKFLIIPAILVAFAASLYVGVTLALSMCTFVFEHKSIGAIINRCFTLIKDKWWSTFGLLTVMLLITLIMGLFFSIPAAIVGLIGIAGNGPAGSLPTIMAQALSTIGSSLLSALVPLALGFQYFNLVERQEGVGLLSAIDSIGTAPHQPRSQDEGTY